VRSTVVPRRRRVRLTILGLLAPLLVLAACGGRGPQPIALGQENCDYCRMTIGDGRYAGEAVSDKGKVRKFDSVECLASFVVGNRATGAASAVWVADYDHPGSWLAADTARFLRAASGRSPMGLGIMAFASDAALEAARAREGGEAMRWPDVLALIERHGGVGGERHDAHGAATGDTGAR
jgi:copper chaperone NosL